MKGDSAPRQAVLEQRTTDRDTAQDKLLDGFFKISKIVESPEMLRGWVEWFRRLNIPCVIEKRKSGYALWRKGDEVGRDQSNNPSALNTRNVVFSFAPRTDNGAAHSSNCVDDW
jgi:hypothetical protein